MTTKGSKLDCEITKQDKALQSLLTISVGTQLLEQKSEQSVKKTKGCELRERSLSVLSLSNGSRKDLTCPSAGGSNSAPCHYYSFLI